MRRINIEFTAGMLMEIDTVIEADRFENISEFIRQCVRQYLFEHEKNDAGSLLDYDQRWTNAQQKVNDFSDEELLGIMSGSITVERMERIAMSEIIKRLYLKTLENDK